MDDEPQVEQLENRIDKLESTIEKMMPSRRDALKMGGAALVGGAAMSGTASAGTNEVGTIGDKDATPPQLVDLHSEDINNADTITTDTLDSTTQNNSGTVTTQDLIVNGTATGPFGGGAPVLESGDSITVKTIRDQTVDSSFVSLYNGTAVDVLGGTLNSQGNGDWLYEFDDNTTLQKNGSGGSYVGGNNSRGNTRDSNHEFECDILPPAKDVIRIEVGANLFDSGNFGAEVILKD
jgi:hypothetical protein